MRIDDKARTQGNNSHLGISISVIKTFHNFKHIVITNMCVQRTTREYLPIYDTNGNRSTYLQRNKKQTAILKEHILIKSQLPSNV